MHKHPKVVLGVLFLFLTIMAIVTTTAYLRRSGNTGLDMSQVQLMRQTHLTNQIAQD